MNLDYIVSGIEASQDGGSYVYVTFSNSNFKTVPECHFGPNTSEDLMKNLPKAMANIDKATDGDDVPTYSPTFKISVREYEDMAIRVGDKMTIEIKKSDSIGV